MRLLQWPIARWFAAHAEREHPQATPQAQTPTPGQTPLLLYEAVRGARRVSGCSAAAQRLGIRRDMPLAEANALAADVPLLIEPHDRDADLRMLRQLAEWCEQFSPVVGWQATDEWRPRESPDSLLLETTGLERLFGGEGTLARCVVRAFRQRGLPVRVTVADTIGAAWAIAHGGTWRRGRRAPWIVPPGAGAQATASLPLAALRIAPETTESLTSLGIQTVAEVAALPRRQLSARFGAQLLSRLDQLTGAAEEVIVAHRPPPVFAAAHVLNHPTHRPDTIEAIIGELLHKACRRLAERRRGALRLECRLYTQQQVAARMFVGLYRASADAEHLLGLLRLQLEQVRLADVVTDISLEVTATGKLEVRQQPLFATGDDDRQSRADDGRRVAELVDRLSSRLGEEAVQRPRLLRDAQPEFACRWQALTAPQAERVVRRGLTEKQRQQAARSRKVSSSDAAWSPRDIPPRPLWLRRRPAPLQVTLAMAHGPPSKFRWNACEYTVAASWGPERIETGWWRKPMVRRDYYRVETTSGLRFWLFRRGDGAWFLHGEFD